MILLFHNPDRWNFLARVFKPERTNNLKNHLFNEEELNYEAHKVFAKRT